VYLKCLWIGETRDPLLDQLEVRYIERIRRFLPIERAAIAEGSKVDPRQQAAQLEKEARLLERKIAAKTFLVALDPKGEEITSVGFAAFLERAISASSVGITFLGGGHLGIPERILERSNKKLALSKLTFPHEMARVLLLEQVYRGLNIMKGLSYHR
jgi:23S rRNA (pseudouridine1915-N3)-methyltransferase